MSIPLKTDFATRIMNAAIAYDTGVATPATEASHTDRIVELESQIAALAGEKKETDMRAMERYKNMLHATRHAERVELALEREKEDKLDSELKAVRCFRGLKQRIASLETDLAKAQGLGTSGAQFQELQTANTRLQAELAQEKEARTQVQNTLKHIHAKFEVDKQQIKQQSKQEYEKILDAKEKQGQADLAHQLAAATQRRTKEHEAARQEIECLKQQIQKLQQALDWHKGQLQQQPALHAGAQGSPIAAGIHAGFPLSTQQSPSQVRDQSRKRRRLNSTGDSSVPAPEQQQSYANPAATPTRRKMPAGLRQSSQYPATPARQFQRSTQHASPLQSVQNDEAGERAILLQAQHAGHQQSFSQFFSQFNIEKVKTGRPQLSYVQAWPVFVQWLAQRASQQQSTPMPGRGGPQANVAANLPTMQSFSQGVEQGAPQSPFLPTTSLQQTHHLFNAQSPLSVRATGIGLAKQMQTSQENQQSQGFTSQNNMQSPAMSNLGFNPMLTFNAGHNASSSNVLSTNASRAQKIPYELQSGADYLDLPAQLSDQHQGENFFPSPEGSQGAQNTDVFSYPDNVPGGDTPILSHDNSSLGGAGETSSGNVSFLDPDNGIVQNSFSAATTSSTPFPGLSHDTEAPPYPSNQTQSTINFTQPRPPRVVLGPALLHSGATQDTKNSSYLSNQSQPHVNEHSALHRRQHSEAPSMTSFRSSQPPRSMLSRKHSGGAIPPSTRSATPATEDQDFPVCLHCHEKWWNETCDVGEPCQNCTASGKSCERPKCYLEPGDCTNARCSRVHKGDVRFRHVVLRPKALKREGKKGDAKMSPVEITRMN